MSHEQVILLFSIMLLVFVTFILILQVVHRYLRNNACRKEYKYISLKQVMTKVQRDQQKLLSQDDYMCEGYCVRFTGENEDVQPLLMKRDKNGVLLFQVEMEKWGKEQQKQKEE